VLTVEQPDLSVYQRDHGAEIRLWQKAEERAEQAASLQLQGLPSTKWFRDLWATAERTPTDRVWSMLPDEIVDAWSRGERLGRDDIAFLARAAGSGDVQPAVAAVRTLGLLVDAQPALENLLVPLLERRLKDRQAAVRVAAAEAIWIANASGSAAAILDAASEESIANVRDYMLHAARLLTAG
jgi:hypothetical protein